MAPEKNTERFRHHTSERPTAGAPPGDTPPARPGLGARPTAPSAPAAERSPTLDDLGRPKSRLPRWGNPRRAVAAGVMAAALLGALATGGAGASQQQEPAPPGHTGPLSPSGEVHVPDSGPATADGDADSDTHLLRKDPTRHPGDGSAAADGDRDEGRASRHRHPAERGVLRAHVPHEPAATGRTGAV